MISREIREKLALPIPVAEIGWKPQAFNKEGDSALMVAYVDARWVAERLDEATDGDWEFTYDIIGVQGDSLVIKGTLSVCSTVRQDAGEFKIGERDMDAYKAAVSDALKRCAVLFGVGRELYRMDTEWVKWDKQGRRPVQGEMDRLRQRLDRPIPWTKDPEAVKAFIDWGAKQSLSTGDLEKALKSTILYYQGSKADAAAAVKAYIAENAK